MSVVTVLHRAGRFERFVTEAANGLIGQTYTAKVGDRVVGTGTVIAAEIGDDGRAISLTVARPETPARGGDGGE